MKIPGLRRFVGAGLLLREIRSLRKAAERIAAALELRNAHDYPQIVRADAAIAPTEVTYVDEVHQAELMDIELRLTHASGAPPTEDDILSEYTRRHTEDSGEDLGSVS